MYMVSITKRIAALCRVPGAILAVLLAFSACNTPSVPIPPPRPDLMTFALDTDASTVSFQYDDNADYGGAVVYLYNRDLGEGIITTADDAGRVMSSQPFPGTEGDDVIVTFEVEAQLGSTCVTLREGRASAADLCSL